MIAVAGGGFRAIALDCRGYGLSDPPPDINKFGFSDIVEDILAIIDSFAINKVHCCYHGCKSCVPSRSLLG
ncbi:putative soluble epoxide hydrolase [Helianthus anomalus]